jgi:tyrosyl-tRNA synthetase
MSMHKQNPGERQAQETLARLVTEIVHGPAAVAQAAAATDALFGETPFNELQKEAIQVALAEAPSVTLAKSQLKDGFPLSEALVQGGLATSKSDARRLIEGKGISLSGQTIENPDQKIHKGDLSHRYALIRKGKQGVLILVLK